MARSKVDGVIEAVRYSPASRIDRVRFYETRGPAFSDLILVDRAGLVERIKKGKRIFTGKRTALRGNVFELERQVVLGPGKTDVISTEDQGGEKEHLTGVPVF